MNHFFKLLFLTFLSTIALNSACAKERITIELSYDIATHKLIVNDSAVGEGVRRYDTISWVIKDAYISKFQLLTKSGSNIFTTDPEQGPANKLDLVVAYWVRPFGGYWEYSITWYDGNGKKYPTDPKIPVKPIISGRSLIALIMALGIALFSLFSIRRSKRKQSVGK